MYKIINKKNKKQMLVPTNKKLKPLPGIFRDLCLHSMFAFHVACNWIHLACVNCSSAIETTI